MKNRMFVLLGTLILSLGILASCGSKEPAGTKTNAASSEAASESAEMESVSETLSQSASVEAEILPEEENAVASEEIMECELEDGVYAVEFDTDSSMFHLNETLEGHCNLTVENGKMSVHLIMPSKNIVNLFPGLAKDAEADGAEILEPTIDTVTYSDGSSEEVFGFDLPVPCLEEEFECALIGKKGKWYDHMVSVKNPVRIEE